MISSPSSGKETFKKKNMLSLKIELGASEDRPAVFNGNLNSEAKYGGKVLVEKKSRKNSSATKKQHDDYDRAPYTVKKVREFPVPSRDVTTKLSQGGNNDVITELFLPRGSLVSDIPAGDGKLVNLFYGVFY